MGVSSGLSGDEEDKFRLTATNTSGFEFAITRRTSDEDGEFDEAEESSDEGSSDEGSSLQSKLPYHLLSFSLRFNVSTSNYEKDSLTKMTHYLKDRVANYLLEK